VILQEYIVALSYFLALFIVCIMLYGFTYFHPTPENKNKAKSTYYFRLLSLLTLAAFSALLLRYQQLPLLASFLNSLFSLLIIYLIMWSTYTRYDNNINNRHYYYCALHCFIFSALFFILKFNDQSNISLTILMFINIALPAIFTLKKCRHQVKEHRFGDRLLYGSFLLILLFYAIYNLTIWQFFSNQEQLPIVLDFILLLALVCTVFFGFTLNVIFSLVGKLRKEIITDRLTGAHNRNYLIDVAKQLFSLSKRTNNPLSLIICDIDRFKNINDSYGHLSGDKVLKIFSDTIKNTLRNEDVFIRIGGEEFIILLPHIDQSQALVAAERLRVNINALSINVEIDTISISASFGVTQIDLNLDIDRNINNADMALYEAKRTGRNKVVVYNS